MSSWRVEQTPRGQRVYLCVGNVEHILTPAEAFALLQGAPKIAGAWRDDGSGEGSYRPGVAECDSTGDPASVVGVAALLEDGATSWLAYGGNARARGRYPSGRACKRAADAALLADGWVLVP